MLKFNRKYSRQEASINSENIPYHTSLSTVSSQKRLNTLSKTILGTHNHDSLNKKQNFPSILNNLHRLEGLVKTHQFSKARKIKGKLEDPQNLKQEYLNLLERYKKVKGKCLMTPCKIPRSGFNI